MIVKTTNGNNNIYKVIFCKERCMVKKRFVGFNTHCYIYILQSGPLNYGPGHILAHGFARYNPLDKYSKIVGKKIALTRALKEITDLNIPTRGAKQARTDFWEAFQEVFGKRN
jgi:hypothetical protein